MSTGAVARRRALRLQRIAQWMDMLEAGTATHAEINEWWRAMDKEYEEKGWFDDE